MRQVDRRISSQHASSSSIKVEFPPFCQDWGKEKEALWGPCLPRVKSLSFPSARDSFHPSVFPVDKEMPVKGMKVERQEREHTTSKEFFPSFLLYFVLVLLFPTKDRPFHRRPPPGELWDHRFPFMPRYVSQSVLHSLCLVRLFLSLVRLALPGGSSFLALRQPRKKE